MLRYINLCIGKCIPRYIRVCNAAIYSCLRLCVRVTACRLYLVQLLRRPAAALFQRVMKGSQEIPRHSSYVRVAGLCLPVLGSVPVQYVQLAPPGSRPCPDYRYVPTCPDHIPTNTLSPVPLPTISSILQPCVRGVLKLIRYHAIHRTVCYQNG